jgi:hypothetical protein
MARSRHVSPRFQRDSLEKLEGKLVLSAVLPLQPHAAEVQVVKTEPSRTIVSSTPATPVSGHTFLYKLNGASMTAQSLSPPAGVLSPAQTRHISEVDPVSDLGKGQTIAIVDTHDDPKNVSDADVIDQTFMPTLSGQISSFTAHGAASTWLTKTWPSGVKSTGNSDGWRHK